MAYIRSLYGAFYQGGSFFTGYFLIKKSVVYLRLSAQALA